MVAPVAGRLDADHMRRVGMAGGIDIAPGALKERRAPLGAGGLAEGLDLVLAGEALIGLALVQKFERHGAVTLGARVLADDLAVMRKAEPGHAVEDRLCSLGV